jgi:hypothetical protein
MKRFYLRLSWICKEKEQRMAIDKETVKKVTFSFGSAPYSVDAPLYIFDFEIIWQ